MEAPVPSPNALDGRAAGDTAGPGIREVAVAALWRRGGCGAPEVLVTRRPDETHLGGAWELPGGRIEAGETAEQALRRELLEEVGVHAGALTPLASVLHRYPDRSVRLAAFIGPCPPGAVIRHDGVRDHRWVPVHDLPSVPFPAANGPLVRAIVRDLAALSDP